MRLDRYLNETDNSLIKRMGDNELCHHNNAANEFTQRPISFFIGYLVAGGCTAVIRLALGDVRPV